jgi:hypothetical protein
VGKEMSTNRANNAHGICTPPLLWPSVATPLAEVAAVKDLHANLWAIAHNVEAWASALRLYEFAKQSPTIALTSDANRWTFIASNECVLQLDHLRERLKGIGATKLRACASLWEHVDSKRQRKAMKLFEEYFPGIQDLRHAIAHAGRFDTLPEEHVFDGEFLLVGFREPDRYSAPYERVMHHLDITNETLVRIVEVVELLFSAFAPAAALLDQQGFLD